MALPLLERAGGHDIRVPGEAEDRGVRSVARPEIVDVAVSQPLNLKPSGSQTLCHDLLATLIRGGHRRTRHQIAGELEGLRHRWSTLYTERETERQAIRLCRARGSPGPGRAGGGCHESVIHSSCNACAALTRALRARR